MRIAFTVPGVPQGKGRPRIGRRGEHSMLFAPATTVAYEGLIAHAAHHAMQGLAPMSCAVSLEIIATMPIPASWSAKKRQQAVNGALHPTTKPDIDNIVKAIGDGCNAVVWDDDKQIVKVLGVKRYGSTPGLWVSVEQVLLQ